MIVHVSLAFLVSRTLVGRHVHRRAYTRPTPARTPEQVEPTQLRGRHETFIEIDVPSAGGRSARFLLENRNLIAQTPKTLSCRPCCAVSDLSDRVQAFIFRSGSAGADLFARAGRQVGRYR
jgi:hypothetical protein